jgi:hypothetical protein
MSPQGRLKEVVAGCPGGRVPVGVVKWQMPGMPRWESSGWDSQAGLDRDTRVVKLVVRVVKRG